MTISLNRQRAKEEAREQAFWDREREANMTRRKSLDGLDYIMIPTDILPMTTELNDDIIKECLETIETLSNEKVVNLTGYTNTDLKLMYGAPNINLLTLYDQAYLSLARTLQKWGSRLYELGHREEAKTVLEFAVITRTDVSGTYKLLKDIYEETGEEEKISGLLSTAENLTSASKPMILRILNEEKQDQEEE